MTPNYKTIVLESANKKLHFSNSYLHLYSIGTDTAADYTFFRTAPLDDYLFTLVLEGNGYYSTDKKTNKKWDYHQGDLIICKPGDCFHFQSKGCVERLWFHAVGTAIPEILHSIPLDSKRQSTNIPKEKCIMMSEVFNELYFTTRQTPLHSTQLNALILSFLSYATTNAHTMLTEDNLAEALDYINKNYRDDIPIQVLSEIAHLNHYYFIKQFKKVYGVTPYQYILRKRFNSASGELINTNMSIDEIAIRNGFNNRTHFSQMFKKHYDISPAEYRKRY